MTPRLPAIDLAAALAVVLIWGLNFVAGKLAVTDMPPFLVTTVRFVGVALLLAPFFRPRRSQLPGLLILAALLGAGHFGLLFVALRGLDATALAVLVQMGPPFAVLTAWALQGDRPGGRQLGGIGLALVGVVVIALESERASLGSVLLAALSMALWALSNIQVKRIGALSPLAMNGWMSLMGAPMVLGLSLVFESGQIEAMATAGWLAWAGVAFTMLFSSVVAYTLWYRLLARHPVSRVAPFLLLAPLIGFSASALFLGEPVSLYKVAGGLLTIAGVAVIELGGRKKA
jgi:O-acetylserine/cysteine efflux transporter